MEAIQRGIHLHSVIPKEVQTAHGAHYYVGDSDITADAVFKFLQNNLPSCSGMRHTINANRVARLTHGQRDDLANCDINPIVYMPSAGCVIYGHAVVSSLFNSMPEVVLWDYILRSLRPYRHYLHIPSTQYAMRRFAEMAKFDYLVIAFEFKQGTCFVTAKPSPMFRNIVCRLDDLQPIVNALTPFYDDVEQRYGAI
jgi:hypothetical protein